MKKVLIIGYGDIGSRIAARLPKQEFIGVSRSAPADLPNVEFIQQDWMNESKLILPSIDFSTIVLILKPTSPDIDGYQSRYQWIRPHRSQYSSCDSRIGTVRRIRCCGIE